MLPYDISRCANTTCALRSKCRRTEPGHPTYQIYDTFPGGEDCCGYLPKGDTPDAR